MTGKKNTTKLAAPQPKGFSFGASHGIKSSDDADARSSRRGTRRRDWHEVMTRALTTIAAIVALAVSAAPVASAGNSKKPPPRVLGVGSAEVFELNNLLKAAAKAPAAMRLVGRHGRHVEHVAVRDGHAAAARLQRDHRHPDRLVRHAPRSAPVGRGEAHPPLHATGARSRSWPAECGEARAGVMSA